MKNSLVSIDPALVALARTSDGKEGALVPFARDILLLEVQIAGASCRELKDVEPALTVGAELVLKRETANIHDPLAIMVFSEDGHLLGYVPRAKNEALARLMDAGKKIVAQLVSKAFRGDWLNISVQIYLRDR